MILATDAPPSLAQDTALLAERDTRAAESAAHVAAKASEAHVRAELATVVARARAAAEAHAAEMAAARERERLLIAMVWALACGGQSPTP